MNQRLDLRRRERSLDRPLPSFNREQSMERIRLNREQSIERIRLNRERSMERIRLNREREKSLERARQEIERVRRDRETSIERPRNGNGLNDLPGQSERSRLGKEQSRVARKDQGRSRLDQERARLVEQERSRLVEHDRQERSRLVEQERSRLEQERSRLEQERHERSRPDQGRSRLEQQERARLVDQERNRLVEQERNRLEQDGLRLEFDRSVTNERLRIDLDRPPSDRSSIHSEDLNRDRQMELYLNDVGNMDFYQTLPRRRKKFEANGIPSVVSTPDSSLEDRLQKLEMERDSLGLQVSVLTDQVEAQTDKIHDLESVLNKRDSSLHKELNSRSALETHKLDLMAEVSQMKIRLAASEKERKELEERLADAQRRIDSLQGRLNERTIEVSDLRNSINKNVVNSPSDHTDNTKSLERERSFEKEKTLERLRRKHSEVEKLKKAVECLMASNEEKDRRIDELRRTLKRHKRSDDVTSPSGKKDLLSIEDDVSDSSSTHNSSSSGADHPRDGHPQNGFDRLDSGESSEHRMHMPNPSATSTPVNSHKVEYKPPLPSEGQTMTPPSVISYHQPKSKSLPRSNSVEELRNSVNNSVSKTPPAPRHRGQGYEAEEALKDAMAQEYKNLQMNSGRNSVTQSTEKKKQKGIKKFFGRLRRSSSQDMNQEQLEEFRRSGLRATAGPRLGWSKDLNYKDLEVPFARWDSDQVAAWLHSLGLSMYVGDCKRWVKNGNQLLKASQHDLEKELNIRNPFHRKKLQLALQSASSADKQKSGMDRMDHNMVTRWLDDIGLPQYKDSFFEARVDGRMLHNMTMEDLIGLKITNALHHLSLKSAIHILRRNDFNAMCLIRRPTPEEGPLHNIPQEVMLWSNHRVMEWLRTIDLSEYAPNLRGSGVHGSLMVLEPRFGADIFATILSIPNSKTLLRRHLSTHFVSLIGNDHQHKKRELEARPGFVPLTPNQRIKFKKFGIFGHKRTRSSEVDFEEFVCPLEKNDSADSSRVTNGSSNGRSTSERKDSKDPKDSSNYSDEMDKLTSLLAKDRFLDNVPTSDV